MSEQLHDFPTLLAFRDDLIATAAGGTERARGRSRWPWTRPSRSLLLIGAAALLLAASAAAATLVGLRTTVVPGPAPADVAPQESVIARSARVLGLRVLDPGDGSTWALRAARTAAGERCLTVGQVRGATFGLVGLDGRFRELAPSLVDACGVPAAAGGVSLIGARVLAARRRADVRTAIYGSAGAGLRSVRLSEAGAAAWRPVAISGGAFLTVVRGYAEDRPVRVELAFAGGRRIVRSFGTSRHVVAAGGTPALKLMGYMIDSAPHTQCLVVGAARHVPGAGHGPAICGSSKPERPFAGVRAVRPGRHGDPGLGGYWWGSLPARTLVWGSWPPHGPALRSVLVRTPSGVMRAKIIMKRSFLAVLPARVRPGAATVTVMPRSGPAVTFRGSYGLVHNPVVP
jgi:hypothetical protein